MKWFSGSIDEAVATSKSRKAIFVVFVAGPDEASIKATKVIDTPEISSLLEKDDFVAFKLENGSISYRFFAQIYQLVPVPFLFFIGGNGMPLEVVAGNITPSNLASKIDIVLSKAKENAVSDDLMIAEQSAAVASSSHSSTSNVALSIEALVENTIKLVENQSGANTSQTHTEKIKKDSLPKVIEASSSSNSEAVQITIANNDNKNLTPEERVEQSIKLMELQKQQKLETERGTEKLHEASRPSGSERIQKVLCRCIARAKNTVMMFRDTKSFDSRTLLPTNYDLSDDARPKVLPPVIPLTGTTKLPSDRGSDVGEIEEKSIEQSIKTMELQKQQKLETERGRKKLHEAPRPSGSERIQEVLGRYIARAKNTVMMSRGSEKFDSRPLVLKALSPSNCDLSNDTRPGVLPLVIPSTSTTKLPLDRGSDVEKIETIKKKSGFPESGRKFLFWNKCFKKETLPCPEPQSKSQHDGNENNKTIKNKLEENTYEEVCITCIYYTQQICECVIV